MQFEITPETERIVKCPHCGTELSIHVFDDRIVCSVCWFAYSRDEKTNRLDFAFESFPEDAVGEKYLREPYAQPAREPDAPQGPVGESEDHKS